MNVIPGVLWTLASYALGCVNGGYYSVRLLSGTDLRDKGTGNAGARNAGRVMGWPGFALVFLIDAGKGAIAVVAGSLLGPVVAALSACAAVAGHIWPAQLGFRGGRGLATALGAALALDAAVAALGGVAAAIALVTLRRATLAGALGTAAAPIIAAALQRDSVLVGGLTGIAILVLLANRDDALAALRKSRAKER